MSKIEKNSKKSSASVQAAVHTLGLSDVGLAGVQKKKVFTGFSTWIRVLMQNWRQGTVGCKDRSEVNRTNKKPWKQKGTGRARAGSARSPVWRGGGIVFGPQPRVRTLTVSQKLKKTVLRNLFIDCVERGKVIVADWHVEQKPSTSAAAKFLKSAGLEDKKVMLFLPWTDSLNRASFTNIQSVNVVLADQMNAYDMSTSDTVLVLKKDLENFKEMVSKWS
jgi:large subunit ribosomal protein L4